MIVTLLSVCSTRTVINYYYAVLIFSATCFIYFLTGIYCSIAYDNS